MPRAAQPTVITRRSIPVQMAGLELQGGRSTRSAPTPDAALSSHWRQIAKSLSRACARSGRGACRWSELLHHVIAREAGRLAVDRRRDIVALFLVEAWRLNAERRQRDPGAAASSALFFRGIETQWTDAAESESAFLHQ